MRDAIGGLVSVVIIIAFIVVISSYLAFNVNYTKAFRVKNKVITVLEQYEGSCNIYNNSDKCRKLIREYIDSIGYTAVTPLGSGFVEGGSDCKTAYCCQDGYCIKQYIKDPEPGAVDSGRKQYWEVRTFVSVDMPIVRNVITSFEFFQIKGDTKTFEVVK